MSLQNIFDMVKADRYTQDGCEQLRKAKEADVEDKTYQIGEISQKTGLQKTANGWVKPKSNGGAGAKTESKSAENESSKLEEKRAALKEIEAAIDNAGDYDDIEEMEKERQKLIKEIKKEEKSAPSKPASIKFEDAKKAIENGQVVQWQDRNGNWNDIDPKSSDLVMARDIGSKLRIKTDAEGNPAKQQKRDMFGNLIDSAPRILTGDCKIRIKK